ncbi:MAG: hypothetical protein U9Q75_00665, partial [Pseudomonadota bacterium]|nr:hypothetical protein [Pseudomonadota bacterium]
GFGLPDFASAHPAYRFFLHGVIEKLLDTHGVIRFAHPSGRPVGVQSASALVRLKDCRNDVVFRAFLMIDIYALLY